MTSYTCTQIYNITDIQNIITSYKLDLEITPTTIKNKNKTMKELGKIIKEHKGYLYWWYSVLEIDESTDESTDENSDFIWFGESDSESYYTTDSDESSD